MTAFRAIMLLATSAALVAFCSPTAADGANVPSGTWAGEHIVLEVTAAGATVEFDCAHGTIDAALILDSAGRFDVAGSFTRESGGPTRQDPERAVPRAARHLGQLLASALPEALRRQLAAVSDDEYLVFVPSPALAGSISYPAGRRPPVTTVVSTRWKLSLAALFKRVRISVGSCTPGSCTRMRLGPRRWIVGSATP